MLQGPIGPFFKELSDFLKQEKQNVHKINFWGGDVLYYNDGINFKLDTSKWNSFFLNTLRQKKITDLILFGDRRIYHEKAIEIITRERLKIRIWVFEEGYFRPNWITMDHYGANYRSSIRNLDDTSAISKTNNSHVTEIKPWIKEAVPTIGAYYAAGLISKYWFPNYEYHRTTHPLIEMSGWALKWFQNKAFPIKNNFSPLSNNFYICALQLESDFQIRKYSPFKTMYEFMDLTMKSFSQNCQNNDFLIVKDHPYNEKWIKRKNECQLLSKKYNIEHRVVYIQNYPLSNLLNNCLGVVTSNSSLGLFIINENIKVKALGNAFWNINDITYQDKLDTFWQSNFKPNKKLVEKLNHNIFSKTQYNGSFYSVTGRHLAIQNIKDVLLNGDQDIENLQENLTVFFKNTKSPSSENIKHKRVDFKV